MRRRKKFGFIFYSEGRLGAMLAIFLFTPKLRKKYFEFIGLIIETSIVYSKFINTSFKVINIDK